MNKPIIIGFGSIGGLLLAIGLLWSLYFCILIGVILIIHNLLGLIICLIGNSFDSELVGAFLVGIGLELLIAITILGIHPFKETRFISEYGKKQHIYLDCPTIINSYNIKEVSKLEGLVRFKGSDCKICKEREQEEQDIDEAYDDN